MLIEPKNKREGRRNRALDRLHAALRDKTKELSAKTIERITQEIEKLEFYLTGGHKKRKKLSALPTAEKGLRYFIDIYSVQFFAVKRSERRKNKGKSRKKLKRKRKTVFVKSVVAQPGMLAKYQNGLMGVSPKTHAFKMRREDTPLVQ